MFCGKCGTEVKDGAQFCHGCGARLETGAEDYSYSTYPDTYSETYPDAYSGTYSETGEYIPPMPTGNQPKKKSAKVGIVIGAVLASVTLVAGIVGGILFSNPAVKVTKAAGKSVKAFSSAVEGTQLTDVGTLLQKQDNSQDIAFWLEEIDNSSELDGLGVRVSVDTNLPKRTFGMSVTPFFGAADLVDLQVKLEDDYLYVGSPELTDGTFYAVNTVTIGEDLGDLLDMEDVRYLGCNLFDLIAECKALASGNQEMQKLIDAAFEDFIKSIEVEKTGKKTIEVNGKSLKCKGYRVILTTDNMYDLLENLEEAYMAGQNMDAYLVLLEFIGFPDYVIDEFNYSLENSRKDVEYGFEDIRWYIEELGDLELDVYLNDGYVVAAVCEISLYDSDMEFILNIGGGKNYVDDISLRMIVDGEELAITSSGNHSGTGGEFTDETVVKLYAYGTKESLAKMEVRYAPKEKNDNFEWQLKVEDMKFSAEGQISCNRDELFVNLEKVKLDDYLTFGIEYSLGKYEKDNITVTDSLALSDMTADMLAAEAMKLSENLSDWLVGFVSDFPDLAWYLY